jgi:uncharacterized membrane protein (UPF0182 family)
VPTNTATFDIYYGEETDDYVIVRGSTAEFDYPKGKDNVYAFYDGAGGVPIGTMMRRTLFAYYFNDPNLLLSSYITSGSRIMIRRNIKEQLHTIAPFLRLDHDPYLVISNGRMFWMLDAYTTSSYFPSVQPAQGLDLNYIRNSVKVIVDAFNGTVDFYLIDPGDLPAHLSELVQAIHGHASRLAEAHSLSRGYFLNSGAIVSNLSHGGGRSFL